ncbi:uncharacterized protein [Drosophila tropicalis]|uniref:uncharacterized protein isoform X3 n=1 Tax=Drosophila tropicalis TaxID=46794 RepID=UPI0035ABB8F5
MKLLLSLMLLLVAAIATVAAEAKAAAASHSSSAGGAYFGKFVARSKICQRYEEVIKSSYPICELQYVFSLTYKRCRFTCNLSQLVMDHCETYYVGRNYYPRCEDLFCTDKP